MDWPGEQEETYNPWSIVNLVFHPSNSPISSLSGLS